MATLTNEWISLEQAQEWLNTYDPSWISDEIVAEVTRELRRGTRPRWRGALIIDARSNSCVDGLHHLTTLVGRGRGGQRWVARASDFVFAQTHFETQPDGRELMVTRKEDSVETHAFNVRHVQGNVYEFDPKGSEGPAPRRIQRQRTKGWRMPVNTVYVGRPTCWGNPYKVGVDGTAEACVALFIEQYQHDTAYRARVRQELAGKDLACWCAMGDPCHAEVLLRWANTPA